MSARIIKKLDTETLNEVANFQIFNRNTPENSSRSALAKFVASDIEEAAIKHLVQSMKKDQLVEAVEYLNIDHGANNPKNSMVLSKRLKESMLDEGIRGWLANCEDEAIVRQIGKALQIRGFSSLGIRVLRKTIEEELDIIGSQIIFGSLSLQLLRDCCYDMQIENADVPSSKKALLQAMTLGVKIPPPQKTKRRGTRKPKFVEIDDEEATYDQLFQHYYVDQLVAWCKENGLKSSGTKKALINRILAYHAGDKENTMVDPTKANRASKSKGRPAKAKSTKAKSATAKSAKAKPAKKIVDEEMEEVSEEQPAEEVSAEEPSAGEPSADEPSADEASAEPSAEEVAAEISESEEDVNMDVSASEEEDPEHPTTLEGLVIARGSKSSSYSTGKLTDLIQKYGGVFHQDKKITSAVNVLILNQDVIDSKKFAKLEKKGVRLVTYDFFKNLE